MRILWVKAGKLLPVDTGGKIRSYNLLRHLAARHELTLLSYYDGPSSPEYESELGHHFSGGVAVHTRSASTSALDYVRHILSPAPYAVTKFASHRVKHLIATWMAERRFDVAVCDFLSASMNFDGPPVVPCVLFQHNVESILWQRQARHERSPLRRLAFGIEAAKMARYERAAVRRFAHVIAVSERDRETMSAMVEPSRISVVPTGVDVTQYRRAAGTPATAPIVTFLGSMDWYANVDAVEYFFNDIWPAIRTAVPTARLRVVGRNPDTRITRLATLGVEVTGTVPSVVKYLQEAAVVIVPLRIGGGTRLKIFEAMAAGRAIVSTSVGAEGLDVTDGHNIVLADTSAQFAEGVISLLVDSKRRAAIARAAAECAARHDWPEVATTFEQILQNTLAKPVPAMPQPERISA